ncbi:glycosyltransferase family protein [Mesonia aquimarina]|uniref:glycosyltransferase family protein n=1 Tax=Mesonia aquimarina TaxID=1504967 RepID=UPI000EF62944|nr:glycosyltransferase family protein [Mesonia aquimarina]
MAKKKILVAPLYWGLGHATRCIPIIKKLEHLGFTPVIASDGAALLLLKKEFPHLQSIQLPAVDIKYSKKGIFFKWKILLSSFRFLKTIKAEHKFVDKLIETEKISGIISDNRLGVFSKKVPSIFITHQLRVISGSTTYFSSKIHQHYIKKFDECWVPDVKGTPNLSGKLGHLKKIKGFKLRYIGPLSRFEKETSAPIYDLLIILSGPEPQRSILEKKLLKIFKNTTQKIIFIKGIVEEKQTKHQENNITIYNYASGKNLEQFFNQSKIVLARAGYTTLMDCAKLDKKAFFIPTPGQFEQVYLAKRLKKLGIAPSCKQHEFSLKHLEEIDNYKGLQEIQSTVGFSRLFSLFNGE